MLRLLNTKTGEFKVFADPRKVRYGILSHVWSTDGSEQSYETTCDIIAKTPAGTPPLSRYSEKIQRFCEVASKDGLEWCWVDFSCINKTSSSELTEAINSMFDWYRYAGTCYAFLHDLPDIDARDSSFDEEFGSCKWFTRAWTLQELLAPRVLLFLSGTWRTIGSKNSLASVLESVTGIDTSVLTTNPPKLEAVSIARKMSWAASRTATRVEDEAYSLMGIFGVTIPISYGEGRYAFIRLQEEIVKRYPDQTIFAWGHILPHYDFRFSPSGYADAETCNPLTVPPSLNEYFFASGPRHFQESSTFRSLSQGTFAELLGLPQEVTYQVFTATSYGMHAQVPLLKVYHDDPHVNLPTHLALLACEDHNNNLLALLLRPHDEANPRKFLVGAVVGHTRTLVGSETLLQTYYYRVTFISRERVISLRQDIEVVDLYIPHRPPITAQTLELEEATHAALRDSRESFEVRLCGWSRTLLAQNGYELTPTTDANIARHDGHLIPTPSSASTTSAAVISNSEEYITIRIGRCSCRLGGQFNLLAVMVSARGRSSSLGERQFQGQHYEKHHPAHIQSWCFGSGFASKEVCLESVTRDPLTLLLTFSHDTQNTIGDPRTKVYRLGVEILSASPSFEPPLSASPVSMDQNPRSYQARASSSMHATDLENNSVLRHTLPSAVSATHLGSRPKNLTLQVGTSGQTSITSKRSLLPSRQTSSQLQVPAGRDFAATAAIHTTRPSPLISPTSPLRTTSTRSIASPSSPSLSPYSSDVVRAGGHGQSNDIDPPGLPRRTPSSQSLKSDSFSVGVAPSVLSAIPRASSRLQASTSMPVGSPGPSLVQSEGGKPLDPQDLPKTRLPICRSISDKPVLTGVERRQPTRKQDQKGNGRGQPPQPEASTQHGVHVRSTQQGSRAEWK